MSEQQDQDEWPYSDEKQVLFNNYFGLLSGNASENTIPTRKSNLKTFFAYLEEQDIPLEEFTSQDMTQYASELQNRGMAHPSIGACVDAVSKFFIWLVQEDSRTDITENPLEGWSLQHHDFLDIDPNVAKQTRILKDRGDTDDAIIALPKEQIELLFEHPGSPALLKELVLRLFWDTGVRSAELVSIRKRDINREEQKIRIRSSKTEPSDSNHIRYVYYSEETDWLLTQWLDFEERDVMNPSAPPWEMDDEDEEKHGIRDGDQYMLLTDQSSQMRSSFSSRIVKRAAKRAGINEPLYVDAAGNTRWLVTAHTIRHSHISHHCNVLETPLHMVAKLAGHRKLDTTRQYVSTDWDAISQRAQDFF